MAEITGIEFRLDSEEKLTDWTNEPSVRDLKADLESSKGYQTTQVAKIREWGDQLYVKGGAKPPAVKGRSSVQPKLIRRQAEWRYPGLSEPFLSSDKLFSVSPATFEDKLAAEQNELVLNWQFRTKMNRINFIDNYVRTVVDEGTCIVRLGWQRETVPVTETVPVWEHYPIQDEESLMMLQQAVEMRSMDIRGFNENAPEEVKAAVDYFLETGEPTTAIQVGEEEIETEKVLENKPTVEIMDPNNVYIDPSCNGLFENALFVIVAFETNKAELQKAGDRYKNLDLINWEGASASTTENFVTNTPNDFAFNDATRRKVVAYEYWGFYDIHDDGTLVPIVATWVGNVMIRMEENPFPDQKLPFVVTTYLPVKRDIYGEPDAELLNDNQRILGAVTRGMIDLLGRSANAQQGFAKGMLDPLNRRRYEQGNDYEFNPNVPPQQGLIEHSYPEIPNSALTLVQLQNQDAESLTGIKSFSGGISGEAYGRVATGIRGALDAAGRREMSILRRLAKGIRDIGVKIIAMNAVFLSEEEVVRVTNEEFVVIQRENLVGNFDLLVDISTAEVDENKAQDLGFMLQTIGPDMDQGVSMMILAEIARLKRMPELEKQLKSWQPPEPTEEQIMMQQLEIAEKQAEVELKQSQAMEAQARARGALIAAGLNEAKIEQIMVEMQRTVSGQKHEEDMERIQSQARGNQDLEITKALTRSRKAEDTDPDIEAAMGYNHFSKQSQLDEKMQRKRGTL